LNRIKDYSITATLIALLTLATVCHAVSISVTGNWAKTITSADLQAGAGSDITSEHQSATDSVSIDIIATAGSWSLDMKKIDTNWNPSLDIYVQRTTDGVGAGSIANGTSYQLVGDIDQNFFSGNGDRTNIKVQLKLSGATIQVTPDLYTTTIYYTVSDI